MSDALVDRAIRDEAGARWQFVEYRQDPPLLPPRTSWMQGAAGIAAFLLRLARVIEDGPTATVIDRPEQWWAVPDHLRSVHADPNTPPRGPRHQRDPRSETHSGSRTAGAPCEAER